MGINFGVYSRPVYAELNQLSVHFSRLDWLEKEPPLPLDKCKESLGGAIQIDSDAREVRYWLDQQEASSGGSHGSRQRAFLHPSSLLFKASLMVAMIGGSMVENIGNPCVPAEKNINVCSRNFFFIINITI